MASEYVDGDSKDWLRGEIIGQSSDGTYEVRYVDFGSIDENQSINQLRWLAPEFLQYPRLAFPISLFCIQAEQSKEENVSKICAEYIQTELGKQQLI